MGIVNYIKNLFGKKDDITAQIKEDLKKLDLGDVGVVDYNEVIPIINYPDINKTFDAALKRDC